MLDKPEGLPHDHIVKLNDIEDSLDKALSFIQAIFLASSGLASREDKNAIATVAGEAAECVGLARDQLDELRGAAA